MTKPSSEWVEERAIGTRGARFWWRATEEGGLAILRVLGKKGAQREVVRSLSREELERLVEFMADETWHPLAASVTEMQSEAKPDGVGSFLYHGLGRAISHCKIVSELATVLTRAGLWEWDGKLSQTRFRQLDDDLSRLDACYTARRVEGSDGPPADIHRQRPKTATVQPPGYSQARSFRGHATALRGRLVSADGGRHGASKGYRREAVLRDFLRQHLPGRCGVGAGEVAEPSGEISRQVDILLYDAIDSEPLEGVPDAMVLAAESLYAAIEVKPILDAAFLREAVETIQSVKVLPRTALDRELVPDRRGPAPAENPAPFGAVLACRGSDPDLLARRLHEIQDGVPPTLWVDALCILDEAVVHRQGAVRGPSGWTPAVNAAPGPYAVCDLGEDALLYFLTLLRRDLRRKRLWPYDAVAYARDIRCPPPRLI
ncbi:DUF6602 domain-containing protein [Planctomycetota bacterium]